MEPASERNVDFRSSDSGQRRYMEGVHPVFVAFVPNKDIGNYVTIPTPWF